MIRRLRHRIAHWFGWNMGRIVTWRSRSGEPMMGFRCSGCGQVSGVFPMRCTALNRALDEWRNKEESQ
jgi:hypothetical protein